MAHKSDPFLIKLTKLNDSNYRYWKLQVTLSLQAKKLWPVVSGELLRPENAGEEQIAWDEKDLEARALLVPTLEQRQTYHIDNCQTSKEMFDKLKSIHSDSSTLNKQRTLASFLNFQLKEGQTLVQGYAEVEELVRSLADMGVNIDEATSVTKIVSALPDDLYKAWKKSWDSVPEDKQTMTMLLSRLKKEDLEQKMADSQSNEKSKPAVKAFQTNNNSQHKIAQLKKKTNCAKCGKIGHWARECRSKQRSNGNQSNGKPDSYKKPFAATAFMANSAHDGEFVWYCDSGASQHVCGVREWFHDYEPFLNGHSVYLTDKRAVAAHGIGNVRVLAFMNGQWQDAVLHDVLHIPGAANLFSESTLAKKGYTIIRDATKTRFLLDNMHPVREIHFQGTVSSCLCRVCCVWAEKFLKRTQV